MICQLCHAETKVKRYLRIIHETIEPTGRPGIESLFIKQEIVLSVCKKCADRHIRGVKQEI